MIDPQFFQEPERATHHAVISWMYDHELLELHEHELRLSDRAGVYLAIVIAFIAWMFVV